MNCKTDQNIIAMGVGRPGFFSMNTRWFLKEISITK